MVYIYPAMASSPNPEEADRRWTARSIGSRWQHGFFYFVIRVGGLRLAYSFVYLVVFWYVLLYPSVRRRTRPYLSRRFPERTGAFQQFSDSYRWIVALGKALVDRAAFGILGPGALSITIPDKQGLFDVRDEGKGMVLLNAHVGCWQVAVSVLDFMKVPVSILMQRAEGDIDRHYFEHSGAKPPFQIIDPEGHLGGVVEMLAVLRRGEIMGVMADRVFGSDTNVVHVDFLGSRAVLPYSGFRLASATGAPVAVVFSYKTGPQSYEVKLWRVIRVPRSLGRKPEDYAPYVKQFCESLEDFVQEHPFQFFNFFNMWENSPVAEGLSDPPETGLGSSG